MKTNNILFQIVWATLIALITILIFFEKVVFDRQFRDFEDYLAIIIPALVLFLAIMLLGQRLPLKILNFLIFIINITLSLTWLFIANCMPLEEIEDGCMCDVCGMNGQMILILLTAVVLPELVAIWSSRLSVSVLKVKPIDEKDDERETNKIPISHTLLFAGLILIITGFISYFGYYFTPYIAVLLPIIMDICIIIVYRKNYSSIAKEDAPQPDRSSVSNVVRIDLWRLIRDLGILTLIGIFSFSTLDHNSFQFYLLFEFGVGFVLVWTTIQVIKRMIDIELLQITRRLEIFLLILALIAISSVTWLLFIGDSSEIGRLMPSALPPIICGIIYTYFWLKVQLIAIDKPFPKSKISIPLPKITQKSTNLFSIWLQLLLLFVVAIIQISLDGTDSILVFEISIAITGLLMILWAIEFIREKDKISSN